MNTPTYRGTAKALRDEADDANIWFVTQITDAILADTTTIKADIKQELRDNGVSYRHTIERASSGYGYRTRSDHEDYFHIWKIAKSGHYGDHRFVLRKDGKINLTSAVSATVAILRSAIVKRGQTDIFDQNVAIWNDLYTTTVRDEDHVDSLSRTEVGMMRMVKWIGGVKMAYTIRIENLNAFKDLMRDTADKLGELA